jgi:hypothetical protein
MNGIAAFGEGVKMKIVVPVKRVVDYKVHRSADRV